MDRINQLAANISRFYGKLNTAQRCYAAAVLLLVLGLATFTLDTFLPVIGIISLVGLCIEMWPVFVKAWESILGKILIALGYLIIGNFALNKASHTVNAITGIDPSSLYYAKGFVTLLMAPIWLFSATLLFLLGYMVFNQLVLVGRIALKLLRLKNFSNKKSIAYPTRTVFAKIVLMPFMFAALISVIETYGNQFESENSSGFVYVNFQGESILSSSSESDETSSVKKYTFNHAIAEFIYNVEAFAFSQCDIATTHRALFIGETDILIVSKNLEADYGYDFTVRPCVLSGNIHGLSSTPE